MESDKKAPTNRVGGSQKGPESKMPDPKVAAAQPTTGKPTPKGQKKSKMAAFKLCLYDPEKKAVLGRTGWQWARVTLFYIVFFSLLLGGLYGMITFIEIKFLVHEHKPNYWGAHSIAFRTDTFHAVRLRQIAPNSSTISYSLSDSESYKKYTDAMLEMLEKQNYKGANNCNSSAPDPRPDNDMCNVDISENKTIGLGSCSCAGFPKCGFGYPDSPCVAVGFNKIIGWKPFTKESPPTEIKLDCSVDKPEQKQFVSNVTVYPSEGIPTYHFPYPGKCPTGKTCPDLTNVYQRPIFMVQVAFNTARIASLTEPLSISCKANTTEERFETKITLKFEVKK